MGLPVEVWVLFLGFLYSWNVPAIRGLLFLVKWRPKLCLRHGLCLHNAKNASKESFQRQVLEEQEKTGPEKKMRFPLSTKCQRETVASPGVTPIGTKLSMLGPPCLLMCPVSVKGTAALGVSDGSLLVPRESVLRPHPEGDKAPAGLPSGFLSCPRSLLHINLHTGPIPF